LIEQSLWAEPPFIALQLESTNPLRKLIHFSWLYLSLKFNAVSIIEILMMFSMLLIVFTSRL